MAEKFVFEKAVARLEEIVELLSRGDAPLEQSLTLFEEGTALIKQCGAALDEAEQKVELLIRTADGPATEPFGGEEER